jgi:hypothetical protein
MLEALAPSIIVAGVIIMAFGLGFAVPALIDLRRIRKQNEQRRLSEREVSEFTYRDKNNEWTTVNIVVDHGLDDLPPEDLADLNKFAIMGKQQPSPEFPHEMKKVSEFVFTPSAIQEMRSIGLEPEEVVVKMLKAAGRI